jgi:multiple sugar transport system permease protein/raffinose/stachyose/melibiose transport system permease protein
MQISMRFNRGFTRRISRTSTALILLVFTFIVLIPFLWLLLMSVKTTQEILLNPYSLPSQIRWQNYSQLFTDPRIHLQRYFLNSGIVTAGALTLSTLLATMGGYGYGRRRYAFRGREVLLSILLFALMLPPQVMIIPQFTLMSRFGLLNTYWALIFLYTSSSLPMSTFLLSVYFAQLPSDLEDSARIDGCNDWMTFWRIMLPLARPAVATVLLLNFLYFWNEMLLSITMVTDPAMRTLPAAIFNFVGETRSEIGMAASSLVMAMLPVMVLYLFLSEKFVQGLTAGAVKG